MVKAVSLARTAGTAKLCAARSLSRMATITRPVRLRRMPMTATKITVATTIVYQ